MKKLFVKYLTYLVLVLVTVCGKLHAHTGYSNLLVKDTLQATQSIFTNESQKTTTLTEASYKKTVFETVKAFDKVDPTDTEEEEDELSAFKSLTFKKLAAISGNYTPAYNLLVPADAYTFTTLQSLHTCRLFLFVPSGKLHILFSVFRI